MNMKIIGLIAGLAFTAGALFGQTVTVTKAITRISKIERLNMAGGQKIQCTVNGKSVVDYSVPAGQVLSGMLTISGELK